MKDTYREAYTAARERHVETHMLHDSFEITERGYWDTYLLLCELDDLDLTTVIRESERPHDPPV